MGAKTNESFSSLYARPEPGPNRRNARPGKVVGLVFGGFNEFSEDVHGLLAFAAKSLAEARLRGLTFLDTHGKVRPYIKPYCERHWRLRQDAAVHWRLRRL
ncbi:hypothetical protein JL722_10198 [Aureococcus anophagefferens]|nr:hypothetical protein JL722_10198 [Aureococcus anophagefferens]